MSSAWSWWCHQCNRAIRPPRSAIMPFCPHCYGGFVEVLEMGNHVAEVEEARMYANSTWCLRELALMLPGRTGPPPASRASVDALEDVKVSGKDGAVECAVCMDKFERGKYAKRMPCYHMYHADCILPWLAQRNSCPLCRYELPTEDPEYDRIHLRYQSSGRWSHPRASMTTSQQAQAETSTGPGRSGETVSGLFHDTDGNSFPVDDDGDVIMQDSSG